MTDLWGHTGYQIIQGPLRGSESDKERAGVGLQEIWERRGQALIFPRPPIPHL